MWQKSALQPVYIGYTQSFLYHLFHEADFSPFNCELNRLLETRYFQVQQTISNIYSLIIQNNISEKQKQDSHQNQSINIKTKTSLSNHLCLSTWWLQVGKSIKMVNTKIKKLSRHGANS